MRILVTGGAGFIGANFVRATIETYPDANITVLDKLTYAANPHSIAGLERTKLIVGDITDADIVDPLVAQADLVVHFAAESHNDASLRSPWPFISTNIVGTFHILESVRRHGTRFHHISTDEVYGDLLSTDTRMFQPGDPYLPSSPYAASKASSDHLVRAWVRSFGIAATISHCCNNYGPYQHVEKFIARTITNLFDGVMPRIYGSGKQVRDWIHVYDHNAAVWSIINKGEIGETYLISAHTQKTNLEVAQLILEECGYDPSNITHVRDRAGHDQRYALDNSKIVNELNWEPIHTDFRANLRSTIEWYRTHEWWWRPSKAEVEHTYRSTQQ